MLVNLPVTLTISDRDIADIGKALGLPTAAVQAVIAATVDRTRRYRSTDNIVDFPWRRIARGPHRRPRQPDLFNGAA